MKARIISSLMLCPLLCLGGVNLTSEELRSVRSGQIHVGTESLEGVHSGNVWAAIWIPVPPAPIWEVMLDCAGAPEFVPGLKSCTIIEKGPDFDIRHHRIDLGFLLPDVQYEIRCDYKTETEIRFNRISGGLKSMEGAWTLERDPETEGTLVTYSVYIEPGFLVPQWLVRQMTRKNLPGVLESLRNRVCSLTTPASIDLQSDDE